MTATGDGAADSPRFLSSRDGEEGSVRAAELLTNVYGVNTQPFFSVPSQGSTNRDQEQHDHRSNRGQGLALQQQAEGD